MGLWLTQKAVSGLGAALEKTNYTCSCFLWMEDLEDSVLLPKMSPISGTPLRFLLCTKQQTTRLHFLHPKAQGFGLEVSFHRSLAVLTPHEPKTAVKWSLVLLLRSALNKRLNEERPGE